ncbi:MAG: hypothetical protein QNJ72_18595 [Pleurocapsa sp. MO_226.B13]|nr:hypothetical protein [Pleurocapsa sp. MO_226.B13]
MSINIETDLKEILLEIKSDLKDTNKKLDNLTAETAAIKTDVAVLKTNQDNLKEILSDVKNKQDKLVNDVADLKGAKSLIIPIVVAVITSITTLLIRAIPIS